MKPVVFDGCFGWLHPAEGAGDAPLGVVLCGPLGNEDVCTRREWMDLADMLAARGLPTLRFDYRGSGDSADPDGDAVPGVRSWLDGIRTAAAALQSLAGVHAVALCGLRLGGALACLAARELADSGMGVAGLAMLAPVVSGRAYVRALRVAASGSNLALHDPPPAAGADAPLNSNGFLWQPATLREIEAIDLLAGPDVPVPRLLLLTTSQAGKQAARFAKARREAGAQVEEWGFPGFEALMNPIVKAVPHDAFAGLADWLAACTPVPVLPPLPPVRTSAALSLPGLRESPLRFGADGALFGVLAEPDEAPGHDFAVLMVNTGTSHHIGNGRILVQMARRLARRGVVSLRMDVAGMGDSPGGSDDPAGPLYGAHGPRDVAAALDALEARGARRVLVFGLCAGAYVAFHAALADRRIAAVAAVNLQVFTWIEGMSLELAIRQAKRSFRSYLRSMSNPGEWRRLLRGEGDVLGIVRALARRAARQALNRARDLVPPPAGSLTARVRGWMAALSDRGVATWLLYSEEDPGLAELAAHLGRGGRRLRDTPGVRMEILPRADHNLNATDARARFIEKFERFVDEVAGPRTEAPFEATVAAPRFAAAKADGQILLLARESGGATRGTDRRAPGISATGGDRSWRMN